jgi:hypothetical protein
MATDTSWKEPAAPVPADSLAYRPRAYFGVGDRQVELFSRVQGRVRRRAIERLLEAGESPPADLAVSALPDDARRALGRVHPAGMGGEYLARLGADEVEIARISIDSVTWDVTSVYARPGGGGIAYRVVDEYEGETLGAQSTRTSARPLTMGELIDFFLGAWDLYSVPEMNFEDDVRGMLGFFSAESCFYPCLDQALRDLVKLRFGPPRPAGRLVEDGA